jgi:hypothetical protein
MSASDTMLGSVAQMSSEFGISTQPPGISFEFLDLGFEL